MLLPRTRAQLTRTDEGLQINLGSATGAYSTTQQEVVPSFVLLDVDGPKVRRFPPQSSTPASCCSGAAGGTWLAAPVPLCEVAAVS